MNDTLEYLFYTTPVFDKFVLVLDDKGIPWTYSEEAIHNFSVVHITEEAIEPHWDEMDDLYDELAIEDQRSMESNGNNSTDINTAGIHIQLSDNTQTIAQVNPDVINRILDVISPDEFTEFIDTVVKSVEYPDDTPVCKVNDQ